MKSFLFAFALLGLTASMQSQESVAAEKSLQHVLVFQWVDNVNQEVKAQIISLFEGLPHKIEGLESFEIQDIITSSGEFDSILTFQFTSEEALRIYDTHPDHERVKKMAPPLIARFAFYDFWK